MAGFRNSGTIDVVYADNVDFSGAAIPSPSVTTNGQLLIGSTSAPNIKVGYITSINSSVTVTNGSGTIDLSVAAGGGLSLGTFGSTPNADGLSLTAGVLNMQPADGTNPGGISTSAQTIAGVKTFSSAPNLSSLTASQALVLDGSKNVTTLAYGTASSANSLVERNANQNAFANNFVSKATNVSAASGTTVLTAASARWQNLTGSQPQTFQLPDATTLGIGAVYTFNNNTSNSTLTVNNNSGTQLFTIPYGGQGVALLTVNVTSPGVWDYHFIIPSNSSFGTAGLTVPNTSFVSSGQSLLTGTSSGTISILPQAAAGTYNFNLPTTAGTSGYLLTSGGGAGAPMTWTAITAGSGITVTPGTNTITIAASGGGGGFASINIQTLTSSGTYTPSSASVSYVIVELVGGGAGGSGGQGTPAGSGGGGGGYSKKVFPYSSVSGGVSVTVGTGGSGGASSSAGSAGNTTSFGAFFSASAGSPGSGSGSSNGGSGGSGSGGDVNISGGAGGGGGNNGAGGNGGSSVLGGGGVGAGNNNGGGSGGNYGGGGGGGYGINSGGSGAAGVCIVTEYIT